MKSAALLRWISGRGPRCPDDSVLVTAQRGTLATPIAFGVAGVIEIVAVHFLIPWPWLQWSALIVSLCGLIGFAGMIAAHRMHPHVLTREALVLRMSGRTVVDVPLTSIDGARTHRRFGTVSAKLWDKVLVLPTPDGTNVDILLAEPVEAVLPAPIQKWRRRGRVDRISVQVDDPQFLVRSLTAAIRPKQP